MFPKNWYDKLVSLLFVQSCGDNEKRMMIHLIDYIRGLGLEYTIDNVGNILVTKSSGNTETYPCVVAHMDTVHAIVDDYKIYRTKQKEGPILFAKSGTAEAGVGGDDKCGVFACMYFLKNLPDVKVVFFTREETGCKGSNAIDHTFFDDARYIIQLDRKGAHDFIDKKFTNKTISKSFASEVGHLKKKYHFKSTTGSITDAVNLWQDGVGISCLNLSSGYYNAHSNKEFIVIEELWNSIMFTKEMIKTLKDKRYECPKPAIAAYTYNKHTTDKWCWSCRKYKDWLDGSFTGHQWECDECAKEAKKTLKKPNHVNSSAQRCSICNFWVGTAYGKETVVDGIEVFICFSCSSKAKFKERAETAICDTCGMVNSVIDGQITILHKDDVVTKTFVCDVCLLSNDDKCEVCKKLLSDEVSTQFNLAGQEVCSECWDKDQKLLNPIVVAGNKQIICNYCRYQGNADDPGLELKGVECPVCGETGGLEYIL